MPGLACNLRCGFCWLAAGSAFLCILPGCRSPRTAEPPAPPRISPVVRGAGSGLETWWWVVSDQRIERRIPTKAKDPAAAPKPPQGPEKSAIPDDFLSRRAPQESALEEPEEPEPDAEAPKPPAFTILDDKEDLEVVLAPYADRPVPLPDEVLKQWLASGLRIYAVPPDDLPSIEQRLRLVAPVQRQWLGEVPAWTDIAAGPWNERPSMITVAGESVRTGPGRLRLLARAWTAPLPGPEGPRPGLRLEVIPQHEPIQTEQEKLLLAAGLRSQEQARGVTFDRLAVGVTLETGDALVIVPLGRIMVDDERIEPFREGDRLLGEAMLSRDATEERARARAVIVILPRIAERFELLGP